MENYWSYALTVFMAFFAIMNPLVNIPIFVKLTEGINAKKKKGIAKTANVVAFLIVFAFIVAGKYIFEIFGLTIPSFKVFGGVLIFYIGFDMLQEYSSQHLCLARENCHNPDKSTSLLQAQSGAGVNVATHKQNTSELNFFPKFLYIPHQLFGL